MRPYPWAPPPVQAAADAFRSLASPTDRGRGTTCRLEQREGRWHANLSPAADLLLSNTQVGPEVAKAQCLLHRAGTAPGDIDGVFGPKTRRAVERMQKRNGLIVNGVIDPPTWQALREATPK
ncbi:peptidoglycan-binding domain-containing protein [Streptomyces globisporus]|uniref:peptidoglycan-binding domain-containing protein n=1 Tax=Streptomyces globisporus TaxID=1908 RepID=UPI0038083046